MSGGKLTYLDYAADCPMHPDIWQAVEEAHADIGPYGANPSSLHSAGRRAREMLESARARVAGALGADPQEVVFTAGGTEADALAVAGISLARHRAAPALRNIVYSCVEHDAVGHAAGYAAASGLVPIEYPVDGEGVFDIAALKEILWREQPAVVAGMALCNENGVIEPVDALVKTVRDASANAPWDRTAAAMAGPLHVPIVTDAVQALGRIPIDFHAWDVDALAIAAHKAGGPVNAGALLITRDIAPFVPGAGASQERGIRAGTQDVIAAQALAATVEHAESSRIESGRCLQRLADRLVKGMCRVPGVFLATQAPCAEHIRQFVLEGCEAESVLFAFDQAGICVSAGSACRAGVARPSPILLAQGYSRQQAMGSLRVSIGWGTTEADIDALLSEVPRVVELSRRFSAGKNSFLS